MKVYLSLGFFLVCATLALMVEGTDENRYENAFAAMLKGHYGNSNLAKIAMKKKRNSIRKFSPDNVIFTFYTRGNPTSGQKLPITSGLKLRISEMKKLSKSYFNPTKPTRFITHGWINTGKSSSCTSLRDAYLRNSDSNVIVVDWSQYSMTFDYDDASSKVPAVGRVIAKMIKYLYTRGLKPDKVTLIGHSLGAHVMGVAGYNVKNKVNNVVGLDPAFPNFDDAGPSESISTQSGKHVQIIHTDAGLAGFVNSIGHSDFYPNGGKSQPGCGDIPLISDDCDHERAYQFFAESITKPFKAILCESYDDFEAGNCGTPAHFAQMGGLKLEDVPPGKYYLRTSATEPYSQL